MCFHVQKWPPCVLFLVLLGKPSHTPKLMPLRTPVLMHPCSSIGRRQPRVLSSEPIAAQLRGHVSAAHKALRARGRSVGMNGCVYLLRAHILGLLRISVSNSSSIPENPPALHHSRGLERLRTRSREKPCVSLHNYTCTGTSNPLRPSPNANSSSCTMSSRPL